MKTIGVLGLQGDVIEHIEAIKILNQRALWLRSPNQLGQIDALIIPGGESTTIGSLMLENELFHDVVSLGKSGLPIFGTCAGAILLASEGDLQVKRTGQKLLGLMDMKIDRNAFGRQKESFEAEIEIKGITDSGRENAGHSGGVRKLASATAIRPKSAPFNAIFIRAPVIEKVHGNCEPIAAHQNRIVAARQGSLLATCFHPELTDDLRVHEYFIGMID